MQESNIKKIERYTLTQYQDLIKYLWSKELCTEGKSEVSEAKLLKFLRDNKIVSDKK